MKENTYTQCYLAKGNWYQLAWIPTTFALVGKVIRIKESDGWDDGWIVKNVYGTKPADKVEKNARDYLKFNVE